MKRLSALLLFSIMLLVAKGDTGWQKVEDEYVSFSLPISLHKTDAIGEDSFYAEYVDRYMNLGIEFGQYVSDFPSGAKCEELEIHGRNAKVRVTASDVQGGFRYIACIYVSLDFETAFGMCVGCKSEKEVAVARSIFSTIQFSGKGISTVIPVRIIREKKANQALQRTPDTEPISPAKSDSLT